jgi:pseudaminic acid synthase
VQNIKINNSLIGDNEKTYFIAEMSGNHNMDIGRAKAIIDAAADTGADAIKFQTYTPDTITIDCDAPLFATGGLWKGTSLYKLYQTAYTPWEWQGGLKEYAEEKGLDCFSSPFDLTAVDFLEGINVPAYKVASFEINDIPMIKKISRTGKPVIISTGIATLEDIDLAIKTVKNEGNENIILLKCVSEYPAPFDAMNLRNLKTIKDIFGYPVGISDHSMGSEAAIAAVALGARVIEKHITLRRADGGPDSAFSMEPEEFALMVKQVRNIEQALGTEKYVLTKQQLDAKPGSRSLFVVNDIKAGEMITAENMRSIRPGAGLHTKYYEEILGKKAKCDLKKGTPMKWEYVE